MIGALPGVTVVDAVTRDTVAATATALEELGHRVEQAAPPVAPERFRDDFVDCYRFLALAVANTGRLSHGSHFRRENLTQFTQQMARSFLSAPQRVIGAADRLGQTRSQVAQMCREFDVILTPPWSLAQVRSDEWP